MDCIETSKSGETFVPKLKSMNIIDLATIFARIYDTTITIIGVRTGEKIHESMVNETESLRVIEFDEKYIIKPAYDTKIYNQNTFDFSSSTDVLHIDVLEQYLTDLGYIEKELEEFDDTTIDVIRKTSLDSMREMTV